MKCAHCSQQIISCTVPNCPGWNGQDCTGWEHTDLFHGCPGGQTCATASPVISGIGGID